MSDLGDSILDTIKKLLGLALDYDVFDTDVIIQINSAFLTLNDLGVGPDVPFFVINSSEKWADFFGDGVTQFESVKTYIYLKSRLGFDPPATSFAIDSMAKMAAEYEWRLNVRAEGAYENMTSTTPELPDPLPY